MKLTKKNSKIDELQLSILGLDHSQTVTREGANQQWAEVKAPSTVVNRRCSHSSCLHKGRLYIYGGYDNNFNGILGDFQSYCFTQRQWSIQQLSGQHPGPRHSHSALQYKGKMYIYGGVIDVLANSSDLFSYDFQSRKWAKITPKNELPKIDSHKVCLYKNKMIVANGFSQGDFTSNIYQFNLEDFQYKSLFDAATHSGNYPKPRSGGSLNLCQNRLIFYGGRDFNQIMNDVWTFDMIKLSFTRVEFKDNVQGRCGHAGVIYDGHLVVFGGTEGVTHQKNDLVVLDWKNGRYITCWKDSQVQRLKKGEQNLGINKSRRDSNKKLGEYIEDTTHSFNEGDKGSQGKYRSPLKSTDYYNYLFGSSREESRLIPKPRKNPLLSQLQISNKQKQSVTLTSTFEILTNSIMMTTGKSIHREGDKGEVIEKRRFAPKARDNYSVQLWDGEYNLQMVIFGGGMHKLCFNDLIFINLDAACGHHIDN